MAFPLAVVQGALMGVAVNAFTNVINDRSPFDNALQSLLLGGVSGGIFGGAEGAVPFGESTLAGNMSNLFGGAGKGAINAGGLDGALGDSVSAYNANMGVNTGNIAPNVTLNSAYVPAGTLSPAQTYGLDNPLATSQTFPPDSPYWNQTASANPVISDAPPVQAEQVQGTDASADPNRYPLQPPKENPFGKPQGLSGGPEYVAPQKVDYFAKPTFGKLTDLYSPAAAAPASTASPKFWDKPWEYLTHKDNRLQAAGVALGGLKLAGAFNPKTGLNNLPPRTVSDYETTYNAPQFVTDPATGRVTYVAGSQGYGPGTRVTRNVAAGGGIRALYGGGETAPYMPRTPTGGMKRNEEFPDDPDAYPTFKRYLASNTNKDKEKGQAEIDANVMAWLKKYSENTQHAAMGGPIDGRTYQQGGNRFAEGGGLNQPQQITQFQPTYSPAQQGIGSLQSYQAPNVPAMESSPAPQYQMNGFSESSMFQPTGGNAPVQPGIAEYIANMNQYTPPAPVTATTSAVTDTTSPTIYDPATQTYSANPNIPAPAPAASVDDGASYSDAQGGDYPGQYGGGAGDTSEKAGGPIKGKKYAMGGLAALPEYAAGGKLLSGDGDGMSDSIPAVIKGARPQRAALADGEFVIPADVVSHLGNGSTKAGGKRLYEMMANIRKARTGNSKQGKQINPMKFIPA